MSIRTRIDKLETVFHSSPKAEFSRFFFEEMTYDEQQVFLLRSCRSLLQDPAISGEERRKLSDRVERTEAAIREMALSENSPACAPYFEEYRTRWRKGGHADDYVPALVMWHFNIENTCDWNKPNLMQRRLELRAAPEIQALRRTLLDVRIGEGA
jgi:hypothetical protein